VDGAGSGTVQGELDRVSQTLTGRIRELAERYATPLPKLTDEVATLSSLSTSCVNPTCSSF
jgi:type I restriction enzyme M protein